MNSGEQTRPATPLGDPYGNRQQQQVYKFTAEELRVLRECNKESFYMRCLPLSTVLAASTYYAVKNGYLKPNLRFGAVPKVMGAVVIGYFVGKFSYQSKCAEKLMQLPNSQIGEMLRKKRKGTLQETFDPNFGPGMSLVPFSNMSTKDSFEDDNPNNVLDIDTTRPDAPGLDDNQRPSVDNPTFYEEEEMPPVQKQTTTYSELRKQNRDEYQQKRIGNYKDLVKSPSATTPLSKNDVNLDEGSGSTPKNKYGDIWG